MNGPAIIQLGGQKEVFVVDLIALRHNKDLDDMLIPIFQNETTNIVGFGFSADLTQFSKYLPDMKFLSYVPKFIDIQDVYKDSYPDFKDKGGSSLATVCERLFDKKLCKKEQMSNWEKRPLRFSQEHYAALDAWVLVSVVKKFKQMVQSKNYIEDFAKVIGQNPNPDAGPARLVINQES